MRDAKIDGSVLFCPSCGNDYLHADSVEAWVRETEDGPGIVTRTEDRSSTSTHLAPDAIPWRRDGLQIRFQCEQCGDLAEALVVLQHKGQTLVGWDEPLRFRRKTPPAVVHHSPPAIRSGGGPPRQG